MRSNLHSSLKESLGWDEGRERGRFSAAEKRLINCQAVDVNQLMPLKYHWAWEYYLTGCANHWMPSEVPMAKDIELWRSSELRRTSGIWSCAISASFRRQRAW